MTDKTGAVEMGTREKDDEAQKLSARTRIILVKPMFGGNIGACVRAMANMGGRDLMLVQPEVGLDDDECRKFAAGARPYIQETRVVETVEQAIEDVHFIVGATARVGGKRRPVINARQAAEMLAGLDAGRKGAILFGPEDAGLSNEDLFHCNAFARIPSDARLPSLNLAQSVMIFLYELRMADRLPPPPGPCRSYPAATAGEIEEFYQHLEEVLWDIEFLQPQDPQRILYSLRRLYSRVERLEHREVKMLRGILAHTARAAAAAGWPGEDFSKARDKRKQQRKSTK